MSTCDSGLTGQRDRAMILLGFAGALRRSELVGIEREHLTFATDGLRLHLPRSKSDQTGEGAEIGIPRGTNKDTCPVRALERWLELSPCQYGPVFRKIDMWGSIGPRSAAAERGAGHAEAAGGKGRAYGRAAGSDLGTWAPGRVHPQRLCGRSAGRGHHGALPP